MAKKRNTITDKTKNTIKDDNVYIDTKKVLPIRDDIDKDMEMLSKKFKKISELTTDAIKNLPGGAGNSFNKPLKKLKDAADTRSNKTKSVKKRLIDKFNKDTSSYTIKGLNEVMSNMNSDLNKIDSAENSAQLQSADVNAKLNYDVNAKLN